MYHHHDQGDDDITIYDRPHIEFRLDDDTVDIRSYVDFSSYRDLDGDERDAAIDRLLDHIDVERLHASIKRRGLDVYLADGVHDPVYDGPATRLPDDQPAVHDPRDYSLELLDCLLAVSADKPGPPYRIVDTVILRAARDRWVAAHP